MEQNLCYHCFLQKPDAGICPYCGYDPAQEAGLYPLALPCGTVLGGRYILGRVLGQGGFGITYVAQDYQTKGRVAVKEFFPDTMATRTNSQTVTAYSGQRADSFTYGKACFLEEAETLAQFIGDPNIIRVHSYFEENGTAYFVMEYVEGESLQHYVRSQGGRISWQEAKHYFIPIMRALAQVHSKGIIHRDVTPDNIFLTKEGDVKLLDFGAARYSLGDKSRSLDVVLKHGFAPKEQYTRHGRQGPYTDVYSLAASLYYVTTGRLPPDSIDRMDEDDLIPPNRLGVELSEGEEEVLLKALSVQPGDRYQNMQEFVKALQTQASPAASVSVQQQSAPLPALQPVQPKSAPLPAPQPVQLKSASLPAQSAASPMLAPPDVQAQPSKRRKLWIPIAAAASVGLLTIGGMMIVRMNANPDPPPVIPDSSSAAESSEPDSSSAPQEWQDEKQIVLDSTPAESTPAKTGIVSLRTEEVEFEKDGSIQSRTTFEYNNAGLVTRRIERDGDNSLKEWFEYEYDADGDEVSRSKYNGDNSLAYVVRSEKDDTDPGITYRYRYDSSNSLEKTEIIKSDAQGRVQSLKTLDATGSMESRVERVYDTRGNEVKVMYYDESGNAKSCTEYIYSYLKDRILMTDIEYDSSGTGKKKCEITYNLQLQKMEEIYYNDDGSVKFWDQYAYNSDGQMTTNSSLETDGSVSRWLEFVYDSNGNQIKEYMHYSNNGVSERYAYEYAYDQNGNILEEKEYYEGNLRYYRTYEVREAVIKEEPVYLPIFVQ